MKLRRMSVSEYESMVSARQSEPDWGRYSQLKREWEASHPRATTQEHQAAMTKIAQECGV